MVKDNPKMTRPTTLPGDPPRPTHANKPVDPKENVRGEIPKRVTTVVPKDMVNYPSHYIGSKTELIDLVCDLPYWKGNAIKYIYRAGEKDIDAATQDLEKAQKFIEFGLRKLRGEHVSDSLRKFIDKEPDNAVGKVILND